MFKIKMKGKKLIKKTYEFSGKLTEDSVFYIVLSVLGILLVFAIIVAIVINNKK